jgi:hypothetical protein
METIITTELQNEAKQEIALAKKESQGEMMSSDQSSKYYSIVPATREEAVTVYNAVNNPDYRLADFINKEIAVKHVLIETVELVNEKSGEIEKCPRTVLIDTKGKSYVAVSFGIFNSMKRVVQMFGEPSTWDKPVSIEVKQIKKGQNSILTLNIVG